MQFTFKTAIRILKIITMYGKKYIRITIFQIIKDLSEQNH